MTTCNQLRGLIKAQLEEDLCDEFDVGYYQNNSVVTIRSADDISELWAKGERLILWCNGLKFCSKGSKHPRANEESDSDAEQCSKKAKKKKQRKESETEERVKEAMEELKQCHTKSGYTAMQFRIWAEMFVGGVHPSLNEPPKSTMFIRAGGGYAPKRRDSFADAVSQIAVALSPKVSSTRGDGTSGSPAKLGGLRYLSCVCVLHVCLCVCLLPLYRQHPSFLR